MQEWEKRENNNVIMSARNLHHAHPSNKIIEMNLFYHVLPTLKEIHLQIFGPMVFDQGSWTLLLLQ